MKATIQHVNMLMNDIKKLAKVNIIKPVSEMNGKVIVIHDHDYEFKIAEFEEKHDSAISTIGVGVMPDWNDAQCKQVFPRVDICTMKGDYIDLICVRSENCWARYKVSTNKLCNLFVNGTLNKTISEMSSANIMNAAIMCLRHIGIC